MDYPTTPNDVASKMTSPQPAGPNVRVQVWDEIDGELKTYNVYVDPALRGEALAKAANIAIEQICQETKYPEVDWAISHVVQEGNYLIATARGSRGHLSVLIILIDT